MISIALWVPHPKSCRNATFCLLCRRASYHCSISYTAVKLSHSTTVKLSHSAAVKLSNSTAKYFSSSSKTASHCRPSGCKAPEDGHKAKGQGTCLVRWVCSWAAESQPGADPAESGSSRGSCRTQQDTQVFGRCSVEKVKASVQRLEYCVSFSGLLKNFWLHEVA